MRADIRCATLLPLSMAAWVLVTPMSKPALAGCVNNADATEVPDELRCGAVLSAARTEEQGRMDVAAMGASAALAGQVTAPDDSQDGSTRRRSHRQARGPVGEEVHRAWWRSASTDLGTEVIRALTRSAYYPLRICWAPSGCASRF